MALRSRGGTKIWLSEMEIRRGYFIAIGEVNVYLDVTPGLHFNVRYTCARKNLCRKASVMKEVQVLPTWDFVGHGYVQHAGGEWRGEHRIWYHSYLAT